MKINFEYPKEHGEDQEPLGDEDKNAEMVQNQVSTLDDLLEKTEQENNEKKGPEILPKENLDLDAADAVQDEQSLPLNNEEEEIAQIKHPQLSRTIGESDRPLQYQSAHFPHDNFGQNPLYANRDSAPKKKRGGKLFLLLVLLLLGILVVGGGVLVLKHKLALPFLAASQPSPTPEPTIAEQTPEPTPTPTPLDRSKFKVRVLNGTGKTGLAASVSGKLKDLGYQIDKTGNASDTTQTTIKVKKDEADLLNQLITDLSPDYSATGSATLSANDAADAEVTLGNK